MVERALVSATSRSITELEADSRWKDTGGRGDEKLSAGLHCWGWIKGGVEEPVGGSVWPFGPESSGRK